MINHLLKALSIFLRGLNYAKVGLLKSSGRIFGLFAGGIYRYIGITFYVLYLNKEAVGTFLTTLNPIPLIVSFGTALAQADQTIAVKSIMIIQGGFTGFEYIIALGVILGEIALILWYFKSFHLFSGMVLGSGNVPIVYTAPVAFVIWGLTIVAVTQDIPFQGVWFLLNHIDAVLQPDRISPLYNATKQQIESNPQVMNQTLNSTEVASRIYR